MSEIDELMDKDPLQLTDQDLTQIIAYQRKMRQAWESGVKPKKEEGPKVDLSSVMKKLIPAKPPEQQIKRRF